MRKTKFLVILLLSIASSLLFTGESYAASGNVKLYAKFDSWNQSEFGDTFWIRIGHEGENPNSKYIYYNITPQAGEVFVTKTLKLDKLRSGDFATYMMNSDNRKLNISLQCEGKITTAKRISKITVQFVRNDTPYTKPGPWFNCTLTQK